MSTLAIWSSVILLPYWYYGFGYVVMIRTVRVVRYNTIILRKR